MHVAPAVVAGLLPKLTDLAEDTWWQTRAALVSVACGLLRALADSVASSSAESKEGETAGSSAAAAGAVRLLQLILAAAPTSPVLRVFIAAAAPLLTYYPALRQPFVSAVVSIPPDARENLLGVGEDGAVLTDRYDLLPLLGPSAHRYELPCIGGALDGPVVAAAIADAVREQALEHLEVDLLQLLLAASRSVRSTGTGPTATGDIDNSGVPLPPAFAEAALSLQDYIFAALCEPASCPIAVTLLRVLVTRIPSGLHMLTAPVVSASLMLLHQPPSDAPHPESQERVAALLAEISTRGPSAAGVVANIAADFASTYPALYAHSFLRRLPGAPQ